MVLADSVFAVYLFGNSCEEATSERPRTDGLSKEIQCSVASHIQSLVKSEKNRQVMCEAGMLRTLMTYCHQALTAGSSPLHSGLSRIFEKLASQAIEPDVLRQFLGFGIAPPPSAAVKILSSSHVHGGDSGCPGSQAVAPVPAEGPLDTSPCSAVTQALWPSGPSQGSTTALQTALSLISMTSPRNLQPQRAALAPSFVEFDMSVEGYGCLFIPTLSTVMGTSTEYSVSGGIGTGGLTFSCWFLVSRHSSVTEGHPLRFLTVVRHLARTEQPFVCFSISLCPEDLSLVVSTEEKELQPLDVMEPEDDPEPSAGRQLRVRCGQLLACASSSITSVADIRNAYNEVDSRLIAKEMNISSRNNAMPVFLLRNCASHLSGSLRTIGAVAVGQLGVRVFHSSPAASSLDFIGGPAILLGLISLATDDHTLYAAVKVLHSVLTSNVMCDRLMQLICGYQIMAFLLRKKTSFLNHRIFQLILSVAGTAELGFGSSAITNVGVFQHILCNFELWMNAADNLELSLFSHLVEILQSPREGPRNAEVAHQARLIPKLVFLFNEPGLAPSKIPTIIAILGCQLRGHFSLQDLRRIGLFVVYTLKPSSVNERQICVDGAPDPSVPGEKTFPRRQPEGSRTSPRDGPERNMLTKEEMFLNLGPDWFLLFVQGHVHPSTVALGLKLLLHFLSNPSLRGRFKDGLSAGSWVECSSEGVDIMMDNLKSHPPTPDQSPCLLPGFRVLSDFLAHHVHIPEVYLIVSTFFLQTPLTELMDGPKDSLDAMLQWLLHKHHREEVLRAGLCTEGALLLLEMLKATMSQPTPVLSLGSDLRSRSLSSQLPPAPAGSGDSAWEQTFPASVLQFLGLVHSAYPQDPAWRAPEFLQTLAAVTFPLGTHQGAVTESTQDTSSPEAEPEGNSTEEGLQAPAESHPTRKQLREFMQLLLRELLLGASNPKQWLPLEVLLEASPDNATSQQKRDFQSEVLLSTMEIFHVMSGGQAPMLRGSREPQPSAEAAAAPSLASISYFIQKLVEKLYSGMFSADPRHILLFIMEHIMLQLVAQRRQELEDNFKTDLSVKPGESEVKIEEVTPLWEEMMLKAWQHYLASEKKSLASRSSVGHHSKVPSWSGSLSSAMRLMPGRQTKNPECKAEVCCPLWSVSDGEKRGYWEKRGVKGCL
ncbi:hypothetical protein J1605_004695 [Eschrichtius robustus]|uniref:WD repeat-and FYVE domain-containing protein 4 n=1 Tax=Eschrichtius robustus TaxID=9764 RepID=A0AB34HBC7_ESCRO|nr:hypothetical protein J1605_004695 [Eschrichtius robustus]